MQGKGRGGQRRRITLLCLRLFSSHEISTGQIEITGNNNVAKGPANVCFPTNDGLPPAYITIPQPGKRVKQRNEQAKESKSISQLHSKMPIAFDFDFDTSLARDSSVHCLQFRVSSDHLLLLLLLPLSLSLLYTASIVVCGPRLVL